MSMHLIFVRKSLTKGNQTQVVDMSVLFLLGFVFFSAFIATAYAAYYYGKQSNLATEDTITLNQNLQVEVNTLTSELDQVQQEIAALDALNNQLIEVAELENEMYEFDTDWQATITEDDIIAIEDADYQYDDEIQQKREAAIILAKQEIEQALLQKAENQRARFILASDEQDSADEEIAIAKMTEDAIKETINKKAKLTRTEIKLAKAKIRLDELNRKLETRKEKAKKTQKLLGSRRDKARILPSGWPLNQGYISSHYGWRRSYRGKRMHKGIDIAAPSGIDIYTVEDGVVTFSGVMRGYGNIVEIKHGETYITRYAHNKKNLVKKGDVVNKGDVIALLGSTGRSTGAHLHFEIREEGKAINPIHYLTSVASFSLKDDVKLTQK